MRRPPGSGGAGEPLGRARGAGAACPWDPRAGGVWRPRRLFLQLVGGWLCPPAPQAALVLRRCVPLECWPGLGARSMGLSTGSCTLAWEPGLIKYRTQRELSACRPSP